MSLDRSATGDCLPAFGRFEAMLLRFGPCFFALAVIFAVFAGPLPARAEAMPAFTGASFLISTPSHGQSVAPAEAVRPGVEAIRRISRSLAMRTTDTQFVIPVAGPAVSAEIIAIAPLVTLRGLLIEAGGTGALVRAPPLTTHIL